jgi:hypothetical protein
MSARAQAKAAELMLRGMFTTLPEEQHKRIMECFDKLEALVKEYGDEGFMALSLAGAKMAAEADE